MANNATGSITITKTAWVQLAAAGEQFLLTPPPKSKTYIIWHTFAVAQPSSSIILPAHRYIQSEPSEGFVAGSIATAACWGKLAPNSDSDSIDCSVTIIGDPA